MTPTVQADSYEYELGPETVRVTFRSQGAVEGAGTEFLPSVEVVLPRNVLYELSGIMRRVLGPAPA